MRKFRFLIPVVVASLATAVLFADANAQVPDKTAKGSASLEKGAAEPRYGSLSINNLTAWFRADGLSNHSPGGDNGMYYPRGTGNVIYQDGIVWATKLFTNAGRTTPAGIQPIRAGGGTYSVGTREGWINSNGQREPTTTASNRLYRIRRDYYTMSEDELRQDAAAVNEVPTTEITDLQIAAVKARYETDWTDWGAMIARGAPYIERNGVPGYQAPPAFYINPTDPTDPLTFTAESLIVRNLDEPGLAGIDPNTPADQVIWHVFNDLDTTQTLGFLRSEPIGLEVQKTIWGYKRTDALGNLYFSKYLIINKGPYYLDSVFVCQWSDPDLGSFSDDLIGCDTVLSMGFVYNANAVDGTFRAYGLPPPAAGYDFLAGPIVPAPGDSAVFNLKKRYGYRNLGMSSFAYFSAGSPYSDPPSGPTSTTASYNVSTGRWWKMLRGYAPLGDFSTADQPYAFPASVGPSKFPLSGNPVAGTGWLDGLGQPYSFVTGDRRLLLNTGPFQMNPGDTQEVVVGVVAGLGSDRKSSVAVMKFNDRFVQSTYDALFQVPRPPATPDVKVTELDGEVLLEWGSNFNRVSDIEETVAQPGSYVFEGYNVYQLPSRGSRLSEGVRIATFDLTSDPAVILDEQFDPSSGQILNLPVQFGSNLGVQRYFRLDRDYVRDINALYNGQEYYLVVTAYSRSTVPGYLPAALESSPIVLTVQPQIPRPGTVYAAEPGEGLTVTQSSGIGDVDVSVTVIDPAQTTGQNYTIEWSTQPHQFSADATAAGTGGNTVSLAHIGATFTLNEAGTAIDYSVQLSNKDSLYSPLQGIVLETTGGTDVKPLSFTIDGVNAISNGRWSTTDGTNPLTAALVDSLNNGRLYVNVTTTAQPTSHLRSVFGILSYPYMVKRGTQTVLNYQQYTDDETYPIIDGLQVKVTSSLTFAAPRFSGPWTQIVKANPATRPFLPAFGLGGGSIFAGIPNDYSQHLFAGSGGSRALTDLIQDLEFRFTGVRVNPNVEDTLIVSGGSIASVYSSNFARLARVRIPFELWENDANGRTRQINVVIRDRNADAASPWGSGGLPTYMRFRGGRAYIMPVATPYNATTDSATAVSTPVHASSTSAYGTWALVPAYGTSGAELSHWDTGDIIQIKFANTTVPGSDVFSFTAPAPVSFSQAVATASVGNIGVFPNPYYAFNAAETNRFARFVTFNYLPQKATIRIFNLAGHLVRRIDKDDASQFLRWDLNNQHGYPVGSGIYVVHVDMPDLGTSKVLKAAIIQEQEILNSY